MIPTSCKATHNNYLKRTEMMKKVLNILFPIPTLPTTTKENLKAKQSTQKNSQKIALFPNIPCQYKVSLKFSQILSTFN